jgi:hypothetical protein
MLVFWLYKLVAPPPTFAQWKKSEKKCVFLSKKCKKVSKSMHFPVSPPKVSRRGQNPPFCVKFWHFLVTFWSLFGPFWVNGENLGFLSNRLDPLGGRFLNGKNLGFFDFFQIFWFGRGPRGSKIIKIYVQKSDKFAREKKWKKVKKSEKKCDKPSI